MVWDTKERLIGSQPRPPISRHRHWWVLGLGVCILLAVRLPFLPTTFEDIDSINFDLGIHEYNPAAHQPHPPGSPVYIAIAGIPHGWFASHATALAAVAAVFGALAVIPLYFAFLELASGRVAAAAAAFTVFNPLVWFTSVRPMSDSVGFCAAAVAQCLALVGLRAGRWWWYTAAVAAGLAGGVRIQTLLLTCPILILGCVRDRSRMPGTLAAFATGMLVWLLPLLLTLGGVDSLVDAFVPVFGDVLAFESVAYRLNARAVALAGIDVFVTPWHSPILSAVMLMLALAGFVYLARVNRAVLVVVLVLFVPYGGYHLLVQDVQTVRYVMPIVPLIAFLAAAPLAALRRRGLAAAVVAVFIGSATLLTLPALRTFGSIPSPAAQAVAHINAQPPPRIATGHYIFDRYLSLLEPDIERLPPPERREWRALVDYWRRGREEPVYYLRQPRRMTLMLFGRDAQEVLGRWQWAPEVQPLLKGARPALVELVRIAPPRWITEDGFMARFEDRFSGVEVTQHRARLRAGARRRVLMASGELTGGQQAAELSLRRDDLTVATWKVGPDFAVHGDLPPTDRQGYTPVTLESSVPFLVRELWFERADRPVARPGRGFYVAEHDANGQRFRWTAERATVSTYLPDKRGRLTLAGEAPSVQLPLTIQIDWNGKPIATLRVTSPAFRHEFNLERTENSPWGELSLRVSRTFIPDEVSGNGDRRTLGVRVTDLLLSSVAPGSPRTPTHQTPPPSQ